MFEGFPGGSDSKESTCNIGDPGLILGLGRSPGEGNGNSLQYLVWKITWTEESGGPGRMSGSWAPQVPANLMSFASAAF